MSERLRIVVSGYLAQYPLGGVTWDYLQWPVGLADLGHDVWYVEDSGQWPYDPTSDGTGRTCDVNVAHLSSVMERFGLGGRWAYRFPWQDRWYGLPDRERADVLASADVLLNLSGSFQRLGDHDVGGLLVYVDTDPVFTQVKLARGQRDFQALVDAHHLHFTFGETLGDPVPDSGHRWLATRQPVLLDEWTPVESTRPVFTTVMNWTSYKPVVHDGVEYGQKGGEFRRFLDLPRRVAPSQLEVALASGKTERAPVQLLEHHGWRVVDPAEVVPDLDTYRDYVRGSLAEWSVAKHGYVTGQPGWFSCRSACYLAAGRPVVVQDTGFGSVLPVGRGLLAFRDLDEAAEAVRAVSADPAGHARAAREIALEHFDADAVLTTLLDTASSPPDAVARATEVRA